MVWKRAELEDLAWVLDGANSLTVCSPYITWGGVNFLLDHVPNTLISFGIWTKFDTKEWLTGASDFDALLELLEQVAQKNAHAEIYSGSNLHAKFFLSDLGRALAGSANLTIGGFRNNIEIVRRCEPDEIVQIERYVTQVRPLLAHRTLQELQELVGSCSRLIGEREALLDLVREVAPRPLAPPTTISPLTEFIRYTRSLSGFVVDEVLKIYYDTDGNHRTGHLKQGYYAVQRFLQRHPQHVEFVAQQPLTQAFDFRGTSVQDEWLNFIGLYQNERDELYGYDGGILVRYLPPPFGGTRLGGGGGEYPFRLVWPIVARMLSRG